MDNNICWAAKPENMNRVRQQILSFLNNAANFREIFASVQEERDDIAGVNI